MACDVSVMLSDIFDQHALACLKRLYICIVVRRDALTAPKYGTPKLPQGQLPCQFDKSINHVRGRSVITFKSAPLYLKMQKIMNVIV